MDYYHTWKFWYNTYINSTLTLQLHTLCDFLISRLKYVIGILLNTYLPTYYIEISIVLSLNICHNYCSPKFEKYRKVDWGFFCYVMCILCVCKLSQHTRNPWSCVKNESKIFFFWSCKHLMLFHSLLMIGYWFFL